MVKKSKKKARPHRRPRLAKVPTGIPGLDDILDGGLPKGRPTLIAGGAGCGKTLLAMEFIIHGARAGEPGVFVSFEETSEELAQNVASLGHDLPGLIASGKLAMEYVHLERHEVEETGEYDLEGLFVRLDEALRSARARRIALDTIESLFAGLSNEAVLRAELRRLFRWLKSRGITAVITGERVAEALTRQGLEEYVSDCVIVLDHRVDAQVSTRRIRVVKYRGTTHGTNEYPFLIGANGITVLPVTSVGLQHPSTDERVSTGIRALDDMLSGRGYYRGSSILVSGGAGTGKSSVAAHFVDAACRRGERCVFFLFEESPGQFMRNMRSIGIDLEPWVRRGRLLFHAARPTLYGLETHLATMQRTVRSFHPEVVVVDPLTDFTGSSAGEINTMLIRLVDFLKTHRVTALFTSLVHGDHGVTTGDQAVSSLMDTWLLLRHIDTRGRRARGLLILKSRGMPHSNDIRQFEITDRGVRIGGSETGAFTSWTGALPVTRDGRVPVAVIGAGRR